MTGSIAGPIAGQGIGSSRLQRGCAKGSCRHGATRNGGSHVGRHVAAHCPGHGGRGRVRGAAAAPRRRQHQRLAVREEGPEARLGVTEAAQQRRALGAHQAGQLLLLRLRLRLLLLAAAAAKLGCCCCSGWWRRRRCRHELEVPAAQRQQPRARLKRGRAQRRGALPHAGRRIQLHRCCRGVRCRLLVAARRALQQQLVQAGPAGGCNQSLVRLRRHGRQAGQALQRGAPSVKVAAHRLLRAGQAGQAVQRQGTPPQSTECSACRPCSIACWGHKQAGEV